MIKISLSLYKYNHQVLHPSRTVVICITLTNRRVAISFVVSFVLFIKRATLATIFSIPGPRAVRVPTSVTGGIVFVDELGLNRVLASGSKSRMA